MYCEKDMSDLKFVNSTKAKPAKSGYAARLTNEEWDKHEAEIRAMRAAGKSREEMRDHLAAERNFSPSIGQLQKRLEKWSLTQARGTAINQVDSQLSTIVEEVAESMNSKSLDEQIVLQRPYDGPGDELLGDHDLPNDEKIVKEIVCAEQDDFLDGNTTLTTPCNADLCSAIRSLSLAADSIRTYGPRNKENPCIQVVENYHKVLSLGMDESFFEVVEWDLQQAMLKQRKLQNSAEAFGLSLILICLRCSRSSLSSIGSLYMSIIRCVLFVSTKQQAQLVFGIINLVTQHNPEGRHEFSHIRVARFTRNLLALAGGCKEVYENHQRLLARKKVEADLSRVVEDLQICQSDVIDIVCFVTAHSKEPESPVLPPRWGWEPHFQLNVVPHLKLMILINLRRLRKAMIAVLSSTEELYWILKDERNTRVKTVQRLLGSIIEHANYRATCSGSVVICSRTCAEQPLRVYDTIAYLRALFWAVEKQKSFHLLGNTGTLNTLRTYLTNLIAESDLITGGLTKSGELQGGKRQKYSLEYCTYGPLHTESFLSYVWYLSGREKITSFDDFIARAVRPRALETYDGEGVYRTFSDTAAALSLETSHNDTEDTDQIESLDESRATSVLHEESTEMLEHFPGWEIEIDVDETHSDHGRQKHHQLALSGCPSLTSSISSSYRAFKATGRSSKIRNISAKSSLSHDVMSLVSSVDAMSLGS